MKVIIRVVVPKTSSLPKTGPPQFSSQLSCVSSNADAASSLTDGHSDELFGPQRDTSLVELFDRCVITANYPQEMAEGDQIEFTFKGEETEKFTSVLHQGLLYQAICLSSGVTMCSSMTDEMPHPYPVARIQTEGQENVFVTMIDQRITPFDKFDLATIATKLARESFPLDDNRGSVVFPLIRLNVAGYLPVSEDDQCHGSLILEQNQQESVIVDPLLLNATLVNEPFLLWIMREEQLVFAAYLDQHSWIQLPGEARIWR